MNEVQTKVRRAVALGFLDGAQELPGAYLPKKWAVCTCKVGQQAGLQFMHFTKCKLSPSDCFQNLSLRQ